MSMSAAATAARSAPAGQDDAATAEFLDIRFDTHTPDDVLHMITDRRGDAGFAYIVTPNVDHLVRLQRTRSDLWPAYRQAWLTLCDSRIIGRLARDAGISLPILPGSDLTSHLFRDIVRPEDRIAILGGNAAMVEILARRHGLTNVCHYNPPMGFIHDPVEVERAVDFLANAHARFSILAVGSPQQEILASLTKRRKEATGIGLCVGASLDFLAGKQRRAPVLMQRLSLEWLFRVACDPRRLWRRYLLEGPAIFRLARRWREQHAPAAAMAGLQAQAG